MDKQLTQPKKGKDLEAYFDGSEQEKSQRQQQQYFDPNQSKKKKIIFWLYLIVSIAFITAVLSLISTSYDPINNFIQSDQFFYSNQVANQWKKGFVSDIQVLNSNNNPTCPNGYQNAFTYQWRGTGFGCRCVGSLNTSFVLQAYCSPALIQANCTNIQSQDARSAHYWKSNSNICIKRSSVSFANEKKFDNTNKICGNSQSLVIVPLSQPCPIVNMSMSAFSLQDHMSLVTDLLSTLPPIYTAYNSTSPYSFYSYPISKFAVSQSQFCRIDEDTGLSSDHMDFVLLSVPKGCIGQGNYTLVDQTTEVDFYANNLNLNALTTIPGFPQAGNWNYFFGFASLPSWTYSCRHNLNGKFKISVASSNFNFQIYSFLSASSLVVIVSCIVIAIKVFILGLRRIVNNAVYPVGYKKSYMPEHFWWSMSRYLIDICCKILILIFSFLFAYNGYNDWSWFKQVQNQKCHHDNFQLVENVILPYQSIHLRLFTSGLAMFIICLVMIIIDAFHFSYVYNNQLAYYLVENNQQLVDREKFVENSGDRLNDLKWMEIDNVQVLQPDRNDDQLRITMAHNMFGSQELEPQHATKLKKKKKKKVIGSLRKDLEKEDLSGNNPYLFDDDIFGNEIIDASSAQLKPSRSVPKRNNINRRKK